MKHKIWQQYAIVFLILAAVVFALVNFLVRPLYKKNVLNQHRDRLYSECVEISNIYRSEYALPGFTMETFQFQMNAVEEMLDAQVWVVSGNGDLILPADVTMNLNEKSPGFLDSLKVSNVMIEGLTEEKSMCAVQPVLDGARTKGYIVLAEPMVKSTQEVRAFAKRLNFIALVMLMMTFAAFVGFGIFHTRNLQTIHDTIIAYTDGDFSAEAKIEGKNEYRDVALSAHMLAEQHANLVEYQKNFVANISHDFRSPLTSIKGYAEAMKDGTIPYEIQGKYLNIILFETERLSNLTNDLLDLSNFENKGVRLIYENFDIVKMLKQASATFEGKCSQKNMKIRLVFPENELFVYADKGKIQQVVHNLIDNAIKFSHPDSMITVVVAEKRDKVLISVKDTGIGIPKEAIGKIWERFYKTDLSRGKDKRGTGLGLSITKQIIAAHNENIKVVSTEGVGTEFVFSLQRADR